MPFLRTTSAPRRRRAIQLSFGIAVARNYLTNTFRTKRYPYTFRNPYNLRTLPFRVLPAPVLSPILFAIPVRTDIITLQCSKRPPRREVFLYLIFIFIAGIIFFFKTLAALVFLFRNGFFGSLCRMISESCRLGKENVCFRHIHGVGRNDYLCGFAV